ncbi:MAG: ATP-dependent DNA ligase [Actinomycetales bacterium]|nr:ATP-dependent DNA ligase [Actinomycetales bacterium]
MLLAEVAAASEAVAAARGRTEKTALLAACLRSAERAEIPVIVTWLSGRTRQRRTGLGWASLAGMPPPATAPTLTVAEVDRFFQASLETSGSGSTTARRSALRQVLARATAREQRFLAGLITGELRHGAQAGLVLDAVAEAGAVSSQSVRRAVTLSGDLAAVAVAAVTEGPSAVSSFGLRLGRPLSPMLAQSAPDLASALRRTGPAAVEWKLDGIRVQIHKDGSDVAVFTRALDDVTSRVPEVVRAVSGLPVRTAVLDGEVLALRLGGRPYPFQMTASRVARHDAETGETTLPLSVLLFDALHLDGTDLVDTDGASRRRALEASVPGDLLVPRREIVDWEDPKALLATESFAAAALAIGHEGVVVKSLSSRYAMGRRGAGWVKVKPRISLDLVVLAAEWGHGRRTGWLSNLYLGARDPEGSYGPPGGFVMLGKTFKGLTDAMLAWQTERLRGIATSSTRSRVTVRPELVVEIAFDGVQTSPRYPAGLALRFARVLAHRPEKLAAEADTVTMVRSFQDVEADPDDAG